MADTTTDVLTYCVAGRHYAVPVALVERVIPAAEVVPLPCDSPNVLGLINLQGRVIPVLSSRTVSGLPSRPMRVEDRMLVLRTASRVIALLVDDVGDVVRLDADQKAGVDGLPAGTGCVRGASVVEDVLVLAHDVDEFLTERDLAALIEAELTEENAGH